MGYQRSAKFSFLLLLILALTVFSLSNQQVSAANYDLSVTVYDPNQQPISGAVVTVSGPVSQTGVTDTTGTVYFDNLPSGNYMISASAPEYPAKAPLPLQLNSNKHVGITFGYTKAYFTATPEHPPVNGEVFFNGTASYSSGSITSYEWNFGDGTTATGPTAYHTYTAAGNYIVILTVTSTVGTATYNQLIPVGVNWFEDVIPEIVVTILLFFVLPLFLLFLWNRRQPPYIIIQSTRPECVLCQGRIEGDCDGTQCKMTPC